MWLLPDLDWCMPRLGTRVRHFNSEHHFIERLQGYKPEGTSTDNNDIIRHARMEGTGLRIAGK